MSTSDRGKLGKFLREVIDWQWDKFCEAEKDPKYTGFEASVFALVRACSDGKLQAIKLAIDRVDGKVETPIKIEYPKIYMLFPHADGVALPPGGTPDTKALVDPDPLPEPLEAVEPDSEEKSAATLTLRETLEKMADSPRQVPLLVHDQKKMVEADKIDEITGKIPYVKSVIAANLLMLANEKHSFEAIVEVFDRIDGKLAEVIRFIAPNASSDGNVYLTSYVVQAPYGAVKNENGIYQLEMPQITDMWEQKFAEKRGV